MFFHLLANFIMDNMSSLDFSMKLDVTTLMTESKEELESLLMRVKKESERISLTLNILKKERKTRNQNHGIWPHYCLANRRGKGKSSDRFPLLGLQNHCGW